MYRAVWPHFVNLLSRSWTNLVTAMGTTTLALVVGFVGFLFVLAINLVAKLRKDGWSWTVMASHFSQNLKDSLLPTAIGTVILWGVLFGYFATKTVFDDHQWLVAANKTLHTKNSSLVDPKSKDDEIASLKKQVEDLKEAKGSSPAAQPPSASKEAHRCWLDNHFESPNPHTKESHSATTAIIHCNYRIDAPFAVAVKFDRDFLYGNVGIPSVSHLIGISGSKQPGNVFYGSVDSPSVPPNQLVTVTVEAPTDQFPRALSGDIRSK